MHLLLIRRRCWVSVGDSEHIEGEAHISGGFGVIQKRVVLPSVVRVDVGSVGKKLHGDVALEVRDTAIDTRYWKGLLGGILVWL